MNERIEDLRAPVDDVDREAVLALEAATETRPLGWAALGAEAERADGLLAVLRDGTGVIGGFVSARLLAGTAHVLRIAVAPALRRRGHGAALLDRLIAWAGACGATEVTLEVRADAVPARALYVAAGFREVGVRARYYVGGVDAVLMTRTAG